MRPGMYKFGTLDTFHPSTPGWSVALAACQAARMGLVRGYIWRAIDAGASLERLVWAHGTGLDEIRVDGRVWARIEMRWDGYVGSWWHGWTPEPCASRSLAP